MSSLREIWSIRHGETEWSLSGAHTSYTDLPLTDRGRERAAALQPFLNGTSFDAVLCSPRVRAIETCRIAGLERRATINANLAEWNYGNLEGFTTDQIRQDVPAWTVWSGPIPGGETIQQVAGRCSSVIDECMATGGRIALFSHGHFLRVFAAVWIGGQPSLGRSLALGTGSISVLSFERRTRVIQSWNRTFDGDHVGV